MDRYSKINIISKFYESFFLERVGGGESFTADIPEDENEPTYNSDELKKYFPYLYKNFRLNSSMKEAVESVLNSLERISGSKGIRKSLRYNVNKDGDYDIIFPTIIYDPATANKLLGSIGKYANLLILRTMGSKTYTGRGRSLYGDEEEGDIGNTDKEDLVLQNLEIGMAERITAGMKKYRDDMNLLKTTRKGSNQKEVDQNIFKYLTDEKSQINFSKQQLERILRIYRKYWETNIDISKEDWWKPLEGNVIKYNPVDSKELKSRDYLILKMSSRRSLYNDNVVDIDMKRLQQKPGVIDKLIEYIDETFPLKSAKVLKKEDPASLQSIAVFSLTDLNGKKRTFNIYPKTGVSVTWLGNKSIIDRAKKKLSVPETIKVMMGATTNWLTSGVMGYNIGQSKFHQSISYGNKTPGQIIKDIEDITGIAINFDPNKLKSKLIGTEENT